MRSALLLAGAVVAVSAQVRAEPTRSDQTASKSNDRKLIAYTLGGFGIATGALGVTFGVITMGNVATGLGITSVLALGAATIVYLTAPRERVVVAPTATASTAGLVVTGSF